MFYKCFIYDDLYGVFLNLILLKKKIDLYTNGYWRFKLLKWDQFAVYYVLTNLIMG